MFTNGRDKFENGNGEYVNETTTLKLTMGCKRTEKFQHRSLASACPKIQMCTSLWKMNLYKTPKRIHEIRLINIQGF